MSKTILLLGASADQVFAIRTAKEMGLRVVTVDQNPRSPGFALADDHAVVSTRDLSALKAFADSYRAQGKRIDGVMVMGSDIPQIVVELAQHLGTFHIPMEAAQISVDKYRMKCRFREHGVRLPWFELLRSKDDLARAIKEHGYPLVIKPLDRSGARGVFYLREGADWGALYEASRAESFAGQVMVEEFVPGPQLSTETILHRGKAYTVGLADRNYELLEKMAPRIIENGATVPADMDAEAQRKVDAFSRLLPVCGRIAFGQHQLAWQAQQRVGDARRGAVGIVLEADQCREAPALRARQFHGVEAEARAAIGQHAANVGAIRRAAHRAHLAVIERREQFEHFRTCPARALVITQKPRAVRGKRRNHRLRGCAQRT